MTTTTHIHTTLRRAGIVLALLAACYGALGVATASAGTLSSEGGVLVFRAAPGEKNFVNFDVDDATGGIRFDDTVAPQSGGLCTQESEFFTAVTCPMPAAGIRVETGDGADIINAAEKLSAAVPITIDAGAGDDTVRGSAFGERAETLIGGPGNDKMVGGPGDDVLRGGDGDDELEGQAGNDQLFGEGGNDKLRGDGYRDQFADVIDGGAGFDNTDGDWMVESGKSQPMITVSLDGAANDGRPGENDNATGLEKIYLNAPATLIGGNDADEFTVFNTSDGSTRLVGNGGNDKLTSFDHPDEVDGGAGDDQLAGGYGDDIVTGGPGRDQIHGDAPSSACNYIQCRLPFGNDTIHAQDGEVDSIDCGIGNDTAYVDANDVVSGCENVIKGSGPAGGQPQGGGTTTASALPLKLRGTKLAKALRKGFVVDVTAPGSGKVSVVATRAGKTVAKGAAKASGAKKVAVKLRFTKAGKRALRRVKSASLALRVTFIPAKGAKVTASHRISLKR
ncbi:MAG: calcium-binding protein [Solirubrobacteraceae bacterium]